MSGIQLACSPSHFGVTEIVSDGWIEFQAQASSESSIATLELELWSKSEAADEWIGTPFDSDTQQNDCNNPLLQKTFRLKLPCASCQSIDFTLRHKFQGQTEWSLITVPEITGRLVLFPSQQGTVQTSGFSDLFHGYEDSLSCEDLRSSVERTKLFMISTEAANQSPEYSRTSLGKPKQLVQWLSLERLMSFWMEPNQGRQVLDTPRDSFFTVFQRKDGSHVVLLPVSGLRDDCQVFLKTDQTSKDLIMYTKNDGPKDGIGRIVLGHGSDLAATIDAVFAYTRSLFQTNYAMTAEEKKEIKVGPQWFEEWTDGLFYCTWNAMYSDVTEEKIFDAVAGLDKLGVRVTGVIIDDGWQDVDEQRRWQSFVPPKARFPNGLGATVKELKRRYPYIKHVGVWHALLGYWNGMSPDSWISKNYSMISAPMRKITVPNGLEEIHTVDSSEVRRLYDDFYRYLSDEGITVVKCDVQAFPDDISHAHPAKRRIWRDYQDAFKLASLKYFDRRVIYCMSHVADIFLYALLQKNSPPACLRNSNDFFPDQPESHAWHIFWNAHNDLYTSRLNVLPDWDMFDTTHPQAVLHAMARSLSGGPILITDRTNHTDEAVVQQMVSRSISDGSTRVIRYQKPAQCRYPYLNFNDVRFTKVVNKTYDILALGAFNTTKKAAVEAITMSDFSTSLPKDEYVVFQYSTKATKRADSSTQYKAIFWSSLPENGSDVFSASPVMRLGADRFCSVIGLIDKFSGPVAVSYCRVLNTGHPILEVQLCHLGLLGIWLSYVPNIDRLLITIKEIVIPRSTASWKSEMLVVDVATAWEEMNIGGWSNEINLKIYLRE